jgi:hypothetical protein
VFDTSDMALRRCLEQQNAMGPKRIPGRAKWNSRRFGAYRRLATLWTIPILRLARIVLPVRSRAPRKVMPAFNDHLVPWRPLVFDRYRVLDRFDESVWEFERNPRLERRQLIEFERLIRKVRLRFGDEVVDTSAGTPWLGWWRRQFE